MKHKWIVLGLFAILVLAAFVRLHNLASVPPSPYLDEVSNGYNAYSLFKTGNDEYGKHLPILMQAYNDFRPTLFVYTIIPFIATLGLTVFAIRLPSVVLSILTTLSMFFLTKFLFTKSREEKTVDKFSLTNNTNLLGLLAAFLFAISPWSIYSSHISDEINMSLSFFVFGLTFFLYALNTKTKENKMKFSFLVSIIFFVVAFYSYHGIKLFLPIFILGISIIFFKDFLKRMRMTLYGVILGIVLLVPLVFAFQIGGAGSRLGGVSTSHPELISLSAQRILYDATQPTLFGEVFDNRRLLLTLEFFNNYLRNLDPTWLFLSQEIKTYLVPNVGPMYLFELPLLVLGFFYLAKDKSLSNKIKVLLLIWIFASPIPAGISSESPHLNRINTLLPALTVLEAVGLYIICLAIYYSRNLLIKLAGFSLVVVTIIFSFFWFWQSYFFEFPHEKSKVFQYGVMQAFTYAKAHEDHYAKIIVSNNDTLLDGYMYYLFTTKYDPALYQKNGGTHSAFFTDTHLIGKYDFRDPNIYVPKSAGKKDAILYIVNPEEVSQKTVKDEELRVIQKYQFLDGKYGLWLMEGKL